ncbi:F-box protein At5g51370 [Selaginella moellendorffii]|uniref:F-box protein At5g51370 n=1 Tax=Selaginella moellendorffii TaxID=88036 RepID=UPI000D1C944D|nr:F-box protein At5g51370 [Selaginella moellendorffii]|eukprot:XP_024534910.1 F-box protein At5g51370 [Selaginella moellendorffii]
MCQKGAPGEGSQSSQIDLAMQQHHHQIRGKGLGNKIDPAKFLAGTDLTALLTDEILLSILARLPGGSSPYPCSLVCKRWLRLHGLLRRSLKLHEWSYLESGRLKARFPNLTDLDLTQASVLVPRNCSAVLLTHGSYTLPLTPDVVDIFPVERCIQEHELSPAALDSGLKILGDSFSGLQRLSLKDVYRERSIKGLLRVFDDSRAAVEEKKQQPIAVVTLSSDRASSKVVPLSSERAPSSKMVAEIEAGLAYVARSCPMLQELELLQCTDEALTAMSACRHLQIVRLVGLVTEHYLGTFTDIGLTVLANRFSRIVKLELMGCEASYHGIAAIGQCCFMLEELTLSTKGFQRGWIAALSKCSCLKKLCLVSCRNIDVDPGPPEYLGHCSALDCLKLAKCDLRDRLGFAALLSVCRNVRELEFNDCWGLEDETFSMASKCRRTRLLSLEGCSLLTTSGLEAAVMAWKDLQRLRVTFCDNIRDSEVSPALANCFASLKEFKWRPDTRSLLAASLAGTGVGQKGGRFFKV